MMTDLATWSVKAWKATPWFSAPGTDKAVHSSSASRQAVVGDRSRSTRRTPDCWSMYRATARTAATSSGLRGSSTGKSALTRPTAVATYTATHTSKRSHGGALTPQAVAGTETPPGVPGQRPGLRGARSGSRIRPARGGGGAGPRRQRRGAHGLARGREDSGRNGCIVPAGPQDGPDRQRACPLVAQQRRRAARHRDGPGQQADRHPDHGSTPTMGAEEVEELPARAEGRVDEVDHWRCVDKMVRAPRHRGRRLPDLARREGQVGAAETQVPAAEETAPQQPRELEVFPVDQSCRPNDPDLGLLPRLRRLDQLFGNAFAPGVWAEPVGASRARCPLRLPLPERARRAQHR